MKIVKYESQDIKEIVLIVRDDEGYCSYVINFYNVYVM